MWLLRFLASNILYITWFMFYFLIAWWIFGADLTALLTVFGIYAVSMSIALSPVGEILLRVYQGCRLPLTEEETNYLLPIFEEVYQDAQEVNPSLNKGIQIYIMDAMYINAFAIGRQTITVTRGALTTFSRHELKGLLAHELGHMAYGHTKALLLTIVGNFLFTVIIFMFRIILKLLDIISAVVGAFNILGSVFRIMTFVVKIFFEISIFVFENAGDFILSLNSRINEFQADNFAYTIGFGKELISVLYILQKISLNSKVSLKDKLKATHPHIAIRIQNLEHLENQAIAEE